MILHLSALSAECYAVELLAALTGQAPELRRIDIFPGRDHDSPAFRALNPRGTVPVLETGDAVLCDWLAILAHLAAQSGAAHWWPEGAPLQEGLGLARDLAASAGLARRHDTLHEPADIVACRRAARDVLREIERRLWFAERAGQAWLLPGAQPSAADIAVFVHVALAGEGGIALIDYPALRRWSDRVRHLPGFVATGGVFAPAG